MFYVTKTKECREEKKKFVFSPPWEPPDSSLLLGDPGLLINLPRNWLSQNLKSQALILTGWISLKSKGLSRVSYNTTVQKHQFFSVQYSLRSSSHYYMTTGKTIALTRQTFVDKVISLLFSTLSMFVIAFLPRSKHLLI